MTPTHLTALSDPEPEAAARVDVEAAERAAGDLLAALGADLRDESLSGTPRRLARLYAELLGPAPFNATTFPNDGGYDELVVARGIPFHSLCEHHLMPFVGVAHVWDVTDSIKALIGSRRQVNPSALGDRDVPLEADLVAL